MRSHGITGTAAAASGSPEEYRYAAGGGIGVAIWDGLRDIAHGLALYRTWLTLGWRDMRRQTAQTMLGPLWSILGTGMQVAALGYVFGALLSVRPEDGFPYVAAGLILWFYIAACVVGGLSAFQNGASVIKERSLPISLTVFRYVFRLAVELIYKFAVFVIVAVLVGMSPSVNQLWAIPGLLLFVLNGVWVVVLFGVLGARFGDFKELVGPLMLIAFLMTPVLWQQHFLQDKGFIAVFNPFTHYLAIVRDPLLGDPMPMLSLQLVLLMTVVGSLAALVAFARSRNRLVFWL